MKNTIFAILILFPIILSSQINSSIDFIAGIDYNFRTLNTNDDSETVAKIMNYRKDETGRLNWRIGLNYNKKLTTKIFLKSGLRLASVGYAMFDSKNSNWLEIHSTSDYWYLEIPITGRYEFSNKKLSFFFELGLAPNIYLTTFDKAKTDLDKELKFRRNRNSYFNNLQFVSIVSAGLNYNLTDQLQLFGQPIFRYHLTKLYDAPIEEHLNSYGLEFGIRKKMN